MNKDNGSMLKNKYVLKLNNICYFIYLPVGKKN